MKFHATGEYYKGDFNMNTFEGNFLIIDNEIFEIFGCLIICVKIGKGVFKYKDGSKYTGDWKSNSKNGQGTFVFPDGSVYEGGFKHHKFNGKGKYTGSDGKTMKGTWVDNKMMPSHTKIVKKKVIRRV